MKKYLIFISILFIIIFSTNVIAVGNMDGETWNSLDKDSKKAYLEGIIDGVNFSIVSAVSEERPEIDSDLLATQLEREDSLIKLSVVDKITAINNINKAVKNNPEKKLFKLILKQGLGLSQ